MTPAAPLTALIAEDEPLLAQALAAELTALWPELRLLPAVADGLSALREIGQRLPRICFLDIRMPGMSGLQVAEALAEDWPDGADAPPFPLLVFVTAYDQYAVQAFERQAVDYVMKPVQTERLRQTVQRLQARLAAHVAAPAGDPAALQAAVAQLRALLTPEAAGAGSSPPVERLEVVQAGAGALVHLVPVDEVIYFEAADKYVRVVTADREHLIRQSLKELLPLLDPAKFWQVHRGTIVQAREVATARREDSGKVTLTLRRRPETLVASRLYAHRFRAM